MKRIILIFSLIFIISFSYGQNNCVCFSGPDNNYKVFLLDGCYNYEDIENQKAKPLIVSDNKYAVINCSTYSQNLVFVKDSVINAKCYALDKQGYKVSDLLLDDFPIMYFGVGIAKYKGKYGLINTKLKWIIKPIYDGIDNLFLHRKDGEIPEITEDNWSLFIIYSDNYAMQGVINKKGKIVVPQSKEVVDIDKLKLLVK